MRAESGANEFIQLDLDCRRVAVLGVLDQEHHQKGNDRRCRVDDQLPRVAEVEERPRDDPHRNRPDRHNEHERMTTVTCRDLGEPGVPKSIVHRLVQAEGEMPNAKQFSLSTDGAELETNSGKMIRSDVIGSDQFVRVAVLFATAACRSTSRTCSGSQP